MSRNAAYSSAASPKVSRASNPDRKLAYTLELVYARDCWLNVNTLRPNALVHEAIEQQRFADWARGFLATRRSLSE